jgi:hypothetical protein
MRQDFEIANITNPKPMHTQFNDVMQAGNQAHLNFTSNFYGEANEPDKLQQAAQNAGMLFSG